MVLRTPAQGADMSNIVELNCGDIRPAGEPCMHPRGVWTTPKLVAVDARLAEADHGETHFDSVGFS